MKKRVLILAAAVLLVLAVPASASKPTKVGGPIGIDVSNLTEEFNPVGERCFLHVRYDATLDGDITGSCAVHEWQVAHGSCEGIFPGKYKETAHLEADCNATLPGFDNQSGSFHLRGNGQILPAADPPEIWVMHWQEHCVILSGTGDLANLHGSLTLESHPGEPPSYSGQIHFDPQ